VVRRLQWQDAADEGSVAAVVAAVAVMTVGIRGRGRAGDEGNARSLKVRQSR